MAAAFCFCWFVRVRLEAVYPGTGLPATDEKLTDPGSSSWWAASSSSSPTSSAAVPGFFFFVLAEGRRSVASLGMRPLSALVLWPPTLDWGSTRRRRGTPLPLPFPARRWPIRVQRL
ncbi:hypothetical protein PVAP13_6KG097900 [Panicum virgatum]|uniref:Secreted protein n=1 Tax=Panicum virgatum TaxID=38727 RepID=A0A8T0RBJ6_PANVG|nr:hypothetical protein PVAP13_6KG097900 [Panicum virgatum]